MKIIRLALLALALFALSTTALMAQMTKSELQQMYQDYLQSEGFRPEIDQDGDITFKYEGKEYYIIVDEDDLEYFTIMSFEVWKIDSPEELLKAQAACVFATRRTKVAKSFITDDKVRFKIELFVAKPEDFKGVFIRSLGALDTVRENFVTTMREN